MKITIDIPIKAQIVNGGYEVKVAARGERWEKNQLGDYADRRGVYIHHSNGRILYVGKAVKGAYGTFGERLRREFCETAVGRNKRLYQFLASQTKAICTYLLDLDDIDMMIEAASATLKPERKALIMELVLIGIYAPEGNREGNEEFAVENSEQ